MEKKKFYISYRIPGTEESIVAIKSIPVPKSLMESRIVVLGTALSQQLISVGQLIIVEANRQRKRPDSQGIRVNWDKLYDKHGRPHSFAPHVAKLFKQLEREGWVVNDELFRQRHFPETVLTRALVTNQVDEKLNGVRMMRVPKSFVKGKS